MDHLSEVKEKKIQLRSINNMRFMLSNLDSLTNNLVKSGHQMTGFKITVKPAGLMQVLNMSYSRGKEFIRMST